jgi:hypothetical protein
MTRSCQSTANFAVVHNGSHRVVVYARRPMGGPTRFFTALSKRNQTGSAMRWQRAPDFQSAGLVMASGVVSHNYRHGSLGPSSTRPPQDIGQLLCGGLRFCRASHTLINGQTALSGTRSTRSTPRFAAQISNISHEFGVLVCHVCRRHGPRSLLTDDRCLPFRSEKTGGVCARARE